MLLKIKNWLSLVLLSLFLLLTPKLYASPLSAEDYAWIGQKIGHNETGGQIKFLTYWSPAEEFPSFGIGHFIWIPQGVNVPFEATFTQMVQFVSQTQPTPEWVQGAYPPWQTREKFNAALDSSEMQVLREWLIETQPQQTEFIIQRFQQRTDDILNQLSNRRFAHIQPLLKQLLQDRAGTFAVIDYANFKGYGDNPMERYQGEGWGLLQVFDRMPADLAADEVLPAFVEAAEAVLQRRIELSPPERNEARWMRGWSNRLVDYLNESHR